MSRLQKYATIEERDEARREQTRASKERFRERQRALKKDLPFRAHAYYVLRPDPRAVAERDERLQALYAAELTPNQVILGDPTPGRSALEALKR